MRLSVNALQGSVVIVAALLLVVAVFVAGFATAVMIQGLDTEVATASVAAAVESSESFAELNRDIAGRIGQYARAPSYAMARLARVPLSQANAHLPGELRELDPFAALQDTIGARADAVAKSQAEASYEMQDGLQVGSLLEAEEGAAAAAKPAGGKPDGAKGDAAAAGGGKPDGAKPDAAKADGAKGDGAKAGDGKGQDAPAPPPIPRRAAPPPVMAGGGPPPARAVYSVELASFRSPETATQYAESLQARGVAVELVDETDASGRTWTRVRHGRFPDEMQADRRRQELERRDRLAGVVIREREAPAAQ